MSEEQQVAEVVADATVAQSGGEVEFDWRSQIPEEIRDHKSLAHFTDVGAMAKSLVNAQSMIGADKVAIPGKHATAEDWGEVWRKLGRPDTPDGYELVNEMPEGIEQNDDMLNWFRATAHEIGMTPTQAQKMLGKYNQFLGTQIGADEGMVEQLRETTEIELKKEYGAAFADRVSNGNAVMQEFGGEGLTELQLADGRLLGDHPDIIKLMVNVGEFINSKIGEDVLAGTKSSGGLAPDDARAKLEEIRAPNSPYWDQRHPEHQFYVQEGLRYQEMLNVDS